MGLETGDSCQVLTDVQAPDAYPCSFCLTSEDAISLRQAAMKHDFDHCDLIPRAMRTNRLLDCGIRADRSSIDLRDRKAAIVPSASVKSEALTVASGH